MIYILSSEIRLMGNAFNNRVLGSWDCWNSSGRNYQNSSGFITFRNHRADVAALIRLE